MNVQCQFGVNIIFIVDSIWQMLLQFIESLLKLVKVIVFFDCIINICVFVDDIQFELMMVIVLVVMIIYLFLCNILVIIIFGVVVLLLLIGIFVVMVFFDFLINNLILMVLIIVIGFVVDDVIVVIENIFCYIEKGEKLLAAVFKGVGEIGFIIILLIFLLIVVLILLLFMGDIVG